MMMTRRKALVGYLLLVVVTVVAVGAHQAHVNSTFDERDRRSCEQRQMLARDAKLVLNTVTLLAEIERGEDEHPPLENALLANEIALLRKALSTAGPQPC